MPSGAVSTTVTTATVENGGEKKEQGACSIEEFTNMYNINTNLDEVEVNDSYLNVVGSKNTNTNSNCLSANQNAKSPSESTKFDNRSPSSNKSESYSVDIEPTASISLPSDLKGSASSEPIESSLSVSIEAKGQLTDQSDHSLHSELSLDDMTDIDSCLQTISNAGYKDLENIVETVVEPLLSVAKSSSVLAMSNVVSDVNANDSSKDISALPQESVIPKNINLSHERSLKDKRKSSSIVGQAQVEVHAEPKNIEEKKAEFDDTANKATEQRRRKHSRKHSQTFTTKDLEDLNQNTSKTSDDIVEPSSCILAAVESKQSDVSDAVSVSEDDVSKHSSEDKDMFDDYPYYLHRRHIVGDRERKKETELYTALMNALNPSANKSQTTSSSKRRRSRSMRRAPNLQIEALKNDEVPYQPRSMSLPAKRKTSQSPGPRSPSCQEFKVSDQGQDQTGQGQNQGQVQGTQRRGETRRSRGISSRSSTSRSPSGNRMIEVVNYHNLPRRDNFSSVDDTTSPTEEIDILSQYFWHRSRSPCVRDSSRDSLSESYDRHNDSYNSYIQPSPATDLSLDDSIGAHQTSSECDSLHGLSEGSYSLSSASINESETSQGSYSLSDLNLSRDDIVNEMKRMESIESVGLSADKIKIEDLDLPFIDDFGENDISENQLANLRLSSTMPNLSRDARALNVSEVSKYSKSQSEENMTTDISESLSLDAPADVDGTENDISERSDDISKIDSVPDNLCDLPYAASSPKNVKKKTTNNNKPVLKPLEIPLKPFLKKSKSQADDELEYLLQQLKDDRNTSPDDLNPADLLRSFKEDRSRSLSRSPGLPMHRPLSVQESDLEELDRLLLETTKFNSAINSGLEYSGRPIGQKFSTFKPDDSPRMSNHRASRGDSRNGRYALNGSHHSVVRVSLSHDVEDIHLEDKPISLYMARQESPQVYMVQDDREREKTGSSNSLSSPRHAVIHRSPSPSRLREYNTHGVKEYYVHGGSDEAMSVSVDSNSEEFEGSGVSPLSRHKRHSYHGETRASVEAVESRRKRLETKRVSFHETVEEITTEAYQTSSSSSDDKSGGDVGGSDIGSPDTFGTGNNSEMSYDQENQANEEQEEASLHLNSNCNTQNEASDSSEEEVNRDDEEFLKFAQSLSECGRDGAADSGVGESMSNTTQVSPAEPQDVDRRQADLEEEEEEEEDGIYSGDNDDDRHAHRTHVVNGQPAVSVEVEVKVDEPSVESSKRRDSKGSSSSDSDLSPPKKDKRPSVDPLESLEHLHDSYVSSSDEEPEREVTRCQSE